MDTQTKEILIELQEQIKTIGIKIYDLNTPPINDGYEETIQDWYNSFITDVSLNLDRINSF